MPSPSRLLPCFVISLLLAGCQSSPSHDTPIPDDTQRGTPLWLPAEQADWLPLHSDPRPGDYAIHYRLLPDGLTQLQRRTEVLTVTRRRIELRRTFGDGSGQPRQILQLTLDRKGRVLRVSAADTPDVAQPLLGGRRQQTRLQPPEPLSLVSGSFPIDRIVTRRGEGTATTVYYLSSEAPFAEVVSLTTHRRYSTAQIIKLLGKIAVATPDQPQGRQPAPGAAIDGGWLLMHWGRH